MRYIDIKSRDNNFYLVRLFLASRVIFGHAFALAGVHGLANGAYSQHIFGSLGVNGFFVISGYLVTMSLVSSLSIKDYIIARCVRIFPALWVMLLITTPLVIIFGSDILSISKNTILSSMNYLSRNMSIIPITYYINGVFENMPNKAINGSLWSMRFEVMCYVALGLIAIFGIKKQKIIVLLLTAILIIAYVSIGDDPALNFFAKRFIRLGGLFFFGSTMALYAEKIRVDVRVALAALGVGGLISYYLENPRIVYFLFGYLIICIAYSNAKWLAKITKSLELRSIGKPDLSYGIYLYSFPIQQILYFNNITHSPYSNMLVTLIIAASCAYFSSQFVEKPSANLRKILMLKTQKAA